MAATTQGALGALILLASASPALAGYWDGDRDGPPDYPAYQQQAPCPPPPCQPCWRGGYEADQDWSEAAPPPMVDEEPPPPDEDVGPPPEDYLDQGVGFVEGGGGGGFVGGGGGGFVGGGFSPGLAIAAQFDFGDRVDVHARAYAHASAHAYARSYSSSYGHSMGYQRQGYQHMSYGPMRSYGSWGGMGSYGHAMSYHPSYHPMMAHGYRRR